MKILLLGKDGQIGWELQRSLSVLGELHAAGRKEVDFEDLDAVRRCVRDQAPDVIVNAAAYTAVDQAQADADRAHCINAAAPAVLAQEARRTNAWLIHYSTDYVFDGSKAERYTEEDATAPLSVYGRTKEAGERMIRESGARHLILRTSWVYAARGDNFAKTMLRLAKERDTLDVVADQHGAPTSAELIADATALALYRIGERSGTALGDLRGVEGEFVRAGETAPSLSGTYHLAAGGATTWHGYAQYLLELAQQHGASLKAGPANVVPIQTDAHPLVAARPRNSRLDTNKFRSAFGLELPDWRHHVQRLVAELTSQGLL